MINYYSTVNEVVTTFSDLITNEYSETILVYFEKPNESGFSFAEYELPSRKLKKSGGFSEDELFNLEDYLICNESLIWELVREKERGCFSA